MNTARAAASASGRPKNHDDVEMTKVGHEEAKSEPFRVSADEILHGTNDADIEFDFEEDIETDPVRIKNQFQKPEEWGNPFVKGYVTFSNYFFELAYGAYSGPFDTFIILIICVAGVLVGVQTYPEFECPAFNDFTGIDDDDFIQDCRDWGGKDLTSKLLGDGGIVDSIVIIVFVVEVVVKLLANGLAPWNYWLGADWKWNNFDFLIVMFSFEVITKAIFQTSGGSSFMVLRLLRLARLVKLFAKLPKLQMIIMGMIAGLRAVVYIAVFVFLAFYIFAIAGIVFFGKNDPFHFRTVPVALLTLFRSATLEDWTDVMYISYFGCDRYKSGIYFTQDTFNGTQHPFFHTWNELPEYFRCENPKSQPYLVVAYWVLFVMVSAFVMLSLFVGAVTIAMSEEMEKYKAKEEIKKQKMYVEKRAKENKRHAKVRISDGAASLHESEEGEEGHPHDELLLHADMKLKSLIVDAWKLSGFVEDEELKMEAKEEGTFIDTNHYHYGAYSRFAVMCRDLSDHPWFMGTVTFSIILAGITVGITSEFENADVDYHPKNHKPNQELAIFLWYSNVAINWIFTVEMFVKIFACDYHPWTYFASRWNLFDFSIVVASWVPYFVNASGLNTLKLLRLLRLFRILRLIRFLPQLAVIVDSLVYGFESIGFIAVILAIFFYLFAILGLALFRQNDPFHFDWTDVMYINMYGCNRWGYNDDDSLPKSKKCDTTNYLIRTEGLDWIATFYFVIFVVVGALVLITLFIGVVTTSMEEAQEKQAMRTEAIAKMLESAREKGVDDPDKCVKLILEAFDRIDLDASGQISAFELKIGLLGVGLKFDDETLKHVMEIADADNPDGEIDPYEFYVYVMSLVNEKFAESQKKPDEAQSPAAGSPKASSPKTKQPSPPKVVSKPKPDSMDLLDQKEASKPVETSTRKTGRPAGSTRTSRDSEEKLSGRRRTPKWAIMNVLMSFGYGDERDGASGSPRATPRGSNI